MRHIVAVLGGLGVSGCALPELVTPVAGTCPDTIDNDWPAFSDLAEGEPRPTYANIGVGIGQVPPDFLSTDQNGDEVCLWQMSGKYVILDASALWCGPCRDIAKTVACTQEAFGDDVVYMTFITQDVDSAPATDDDIREWSSAYGLGDGTQTPVIIDAGQVITDPFPGDGLPSLLLLGPDLRVITSGQGLEAEVAIKNELKQRLGKEDLPDCQAEEG